MLAKGQPIKVTCMIRQAKAGPGLSLISITSHGKQRARNNVNNFFITDPISNDIFIINKIIEFCEFHRILFLYTQDASNHIFCSILGIECLKTSIKHCTLCDLFYSDFAISLFYLRSTSTSLNDINRFK